MAFDPKGLSVLAYANGFTLWHYTTADDKDDVDTAGYFDGANEMLRTGDMILANVDTGDTPEAGIFHVSANAAGSVDVDDMTAVGGSDSD